jgi:excisionase family DNA binding protein
MITHTTMTDTAAGQREHTCVNGERITYGPLGPAEAAFLERVRQASVDPAVTENDLIALIYGRDNPLLDHTMLPGHAMVTGAAFEHPAYQVMVDLLGWKRVQLGTLDLAAARARFTLSVADAAEVLGITPQAVRKAIKARHLASWRDGEQLFLDPRSVAAFKTTRATSYQGQGVGKPPRLAVRVGNAPGVSFKLKHPGELEDRTSAGGNVVAGALARWKRVAVITSAEEGDRKGQRFFVLEPGSEETELALGDFYVRGRFTVVEKINNSAKARDAWKAFTAE